MQGHALRRVPANRRLGRSQLANAAITGGTATPAFDCLHPHSIIGQKENP
jgi:hypothetical protein